MLSRSSCSKDDAELAGQHYHSNYRKYQSRSAKLVRLWRHIQVTPSKFCNNIDSSRSGLRRGSKGHGRTGHNNGRENNLDGPSITQRHVSTASAPTTTTTVATTASERNNHNCSVGLDNYEVVFSYLTTALVYDPLIWVTDVTDEFAVTTSAVCEWRSPPVGQPSSRGGVTSPGTEPKPVGVVPVCAWMRAAYLAYKVEFGSLLGAPPSYWVWAPLAAQQPVFECVEGDCWWEDVERWTRDDDGTQVAPLQDFDGGE